MCDTCVRPGHVCDPDTGRCVCPRLTYGEHCDRCRPGAWDLVPRVGCRPCACTLGATRPHCDHQGQCPCRIGYDGLRCDRCARGYYGYPRCRPCGCSLAGTVQCQDGVCECDEKGQCPCKVSIRRIAGRDLSRMGSRKREVGKKPARLLGRIRSMPRSTLNTAIAKVFETLT